MHPYENNIPNFFLIFIEDVFITVLVRIREYLEKIILNLPNVPLFHKENLHFYTFLLILNNKNSTHTKTVKTHQDLRLLYYLIQYEITQNDFFFLFLNF